MVAEAKTSDAGECFVVMPFGKKPLPNGQTYDFDKVYRVIISRAVREAGMKPLRADETIGSRLIHSDMFKDLRDRPVVLADLSLENPNVFYELGLSHALEKPVVLVSSNEEDVPFDLRHIRTIFYDQTDPFWGQKLINKLADNIVSALSNPEEAIFRVDE